MSRFFTLAMLLVVRLSELMGQCPEPLTYVEAEESTESRQIVKAVSHVESEGFVHQWYTSPIGNAKATAITEHNESGLLVSSLAVTSTGTWWVATEKEGCKSRRVAVRVVIKGTEEEEDEEKENGIAINGQGVSGPGEEKEEATRAEIPEIPLGMNGGRMIRQEPLGKMLGPVQTDTPIVTEDLEELLGVKRIYTWRGIDPAGGVNGDMLIRSDYEGGYKVSGTYRGCNGTISKIKFMGISVPIEYEVTGGGIYCRGEAGNPIHLEGSQVGIVYRLYRNGHYADKQKEGDGTALSFGVLHEEGTYTIMALDKTSRCDRRMGGEALVKEVAPPEVEAGTNSILFEEYALVPLEGMSPEGGTWEGSGASSIHINPEEAGEGEHTLTYTYTNQYGCSNSDTRRVEIIRSPVLTVEGNRTIEKGDKVILSVQEGYTSYRWYKDGNKVEGKETDRIEVSKAGTYQAEVEEGGVQARTESVRIYAGTAPSKDQNYVASRTIQVAGIKKIAEIDNLNISEATLEVQYMDGLGRPMQSVAAQASPQQRDIISPITYDRFGRDSIQYLPYVAISPYGDYQQTAIEDQQSFYNDPYNHVATDAYPYAIKVLESSPLNRLMEQGAPGEAWQPYPDSEDNRTVKFEYTSNELKEVRLFDLDGEGRPATEGYYAPHQLSVTITRDEHNNEVKEYTDKLGQVILKRVFLIRDDTLNTYYIYDDFGNLKVVLPPQAMKLYRQYYTTNTNKDSFLDNWAFMYKYDARKRMVEKKVPGAGWVHMVYDQRDRLVLTQDANQRENDQWIFTKYDHFNRPVMTGKWEDSCSIEQVQTAVNTQVGNSHAWYESRNTGGLLGYDNLSFPQIEDKENILTVTYYDFYDFIDENTEVWGDEYHYQPQAVPYKATRMEIVKGQVTGTMTRIIDTEEWIQTVTYYDNKYRIIQGISSNHKGGIDRTDTQYDFVGKVLRTRSLHSIPGKTDKVIEETFEYDHVGRVIEQYHQVAIGARFENITGVDTISNQITKTNTAGWGNAGALISNQYIPKDNNGFITARIGNTNGSFAIGLTKKYTNPDYRDMDYAIVQDETARILIYEKGSSLPLAANAKEGDVLKVERVNQQIIYKINDEIIYRSFDQSNEALQGAIALNTQHLSLPEVSVSSSGEILLASNEYNELGVLIDKKLHSEDKGLSHKQSLDYSYNIRGWLKTINQSNLNDQEAEINANKDLFGMELVYNEQQDINNSPQYNGNISGMKWSVNMGMDDLTERAYAYAYDGINRIKKAEGNKKKEEGWMKNENKGFDVDSIDYDYNGNILSLHRKDGKGAQLDAMDYGYGEGINMSNKLISVDDEGNKEKGFKDGVQEQKEYLYDLNGNMITDKNKGIEQIWYNHLNLPERLSMGAGKGIIYTYDAAGIKLKKEVQHGDTLKTTDYIGPYVYEDGVLQFIQHLEGRITMNEERGTKKENFTYEYHLKDHLGNVRMTFTSKPTTEKMTATLEENRKQEEQAIFNPSYDDATRVNSKIFNHTEGEESKYSIRLSGVEGEIAGLAKSLAVMPGDTIEMEVFGKYTQPTNQQTNTASLLAYSLTGAFGLAATATGELALAYQSMNELFTSGALITQGTWEDDDAPKAYLNYILFDKDYKAYDMGFDQISREALEEGTDIAPDKMYLKALAKKPGYIYIYLSNENPTLVDVYFDDLNIQHKNSPVIQAEDYYPFGMVANSSRNEERGKKNDYLYNGKELQSDLDLDWYDYGARMYDGSLGRFHTIDRFSEKYLYYSTYQYAGCNPVVNVDFNGDSIISVTVDDKSGFIKGESTLYIDHTILDDTKAILEYAAENEIPIHINSSFRTNKKQGGLNTGNSTTPAEKSKSAHNAGLAIDFNLYKSDKISEGIDSGNSTLTKDHELIKEVKGKSWRWGGDWTTPDRIHMDKRGTDTNFETIRDANQTQMDGDNKTNIDTSLIKRFETITINKKED